VLAECHITGSLKGQLLLFVPRPTANRLHSTLNEQDSLSHHPNKEKPPFPLPQSPSFYCAELFA